MTSERKSASNRRNACASTGPRSDLGKARSSGNARGHGLSVAGCFISDGETESLVRSLVGGRTDRELLAIARRVVAAQVLIGRAQFARHSLMAEIPEAIDGGATRVVADVLARVARLERYECSALAKRRFAFRDFADAWAKASLPSPTAFLQNEAKISKESNDEET